MSLEQRREYLLRAAERAKANGEYRIARSLRRMAADTRPIDVSLTLGIADRTAA